MLLSYIPVSPHLPPNHYKIEKKGLLNGNDLWKNRREKRGRLTCIYHQSCSDWGFWERADPSKLRRPVDICRARNPLNADCQDPPRMSIADLR